MVLGTVSYNLEAGDGGGGHYVTSVFAPSFAAAAAAAVSSSGEPNNSNRAPSSDSLLDHCVRIHEGEVKAGKRRPDFDVDTVIVALRRSGEKPGIRSACSLVFTVTVVCSIDL